VFPYRPEAIYRVFVKVGRVTDFQFGPGETLVNIVLGEGYDGCGQSEVGHEPDKQVVSQRRWIVECPTWSGSAPHVTTHLPVRSLQPNANTNLVIYSNQRVYQLDLVTHPRVHVPMVAWRYPVSQAATTTAQRRIPAQTLETGYVAKTFEGDAPAFIPEWIASSATQTYLPLPETVRGQEMPVLHVRLPDGTTPLVNYRVHDVLITADRVLHSGESFELRTGTEKTSGVVVISRTHTGTLVTCPGVALCEALASARP
jgi:type IV secretion system protein VirB9